MGQPRRGRGDPSRLDGSDPGQGSLGLGGFGGSQLLVAVSIMLVGLRRLWWLLFLALGSQAGKD
jgi:hypothetical protein